jgi:hypothetical protein
MKYARARKLCACATCELLAQLLPLKRFNTSLSLQRFSQRLNVMGQRHRRFMPHNGEIFEQ